MVAFSVVREGRGVVSGTVGRIAEMAIREFEVLRKKHHHDWYCDGGRDLLKNMIRQKVSDGEGIRFVLPSFPCKSQNRDNTLGKSPDLGEELALGALHSLCDRISRDYEPGASIVLASDGRLYADLIGVPDGDVLSYRDSLLSMYSSMVSAAGGVQRIGWYSLDEAFPRVDGGDGKRAALIGAYPKDIGRIMGLVHSDEHYNRVYVGFKNMVISELSVDKARSRNSIDKEASRVARAMMERNFANADLIANRFPGAVRLSIKHHDTRTGKFGVNLLPGHDDVGTPWLNVVVEKDGSYDFIKSRQAQERGYELCYKGDQPYYYRG